MKNKKIIFSIIMTSLLITCGCGNNNSNDKVENNTSISETVKEPYDENEVIDTNDDIDNQNVSYTIKKKSYTKNKISIEYPQISGLDNDVQEKWNKFIEDYTLKNIKELSANDVYEENYEVKTESDKLISILVNTYTNIDGSPYPSSYKRTYNIDLTNGNNVRIKDSGKVAEYVSNLIEGKNYTVDGDNDLKDAFKEYISSTYNANKEELTETINNYDLDVDKELDYDYGYFKGYSYYENGKTILCMNVPHALGDCIEVTMD